MKHYVFAIFFVKRLLNEARKNLIAVIKIKRKFKHNITLSIQEKTLWLLLNRVKPVQTLRYNEANVEVVSLISHQDLSLYLTAIKTLFYYSKKQFFVTVFDDGTLTSDDVKMLKSFVLGVRFVSLKQANKKLQPLLRTNKYCQKYRREVLMTRKIIDLIFLALKKRILMFDSDLIFFKKPTEIIDWIDSGSDNPIFMSDGRNVYIISDVEAKQCFGLPFVPRVNTGLIGFSTEIITIHFIENFLKELTHLDAWGKRMWLVVEQTVLGLLLSTIPNKKLTRLPQSYLVTLEQNPMNVVCRHYVKPVRELFYPKAAATLSQILREEKHSISY